MTWHEHWLFKDIRSAAVGALVGAVTGLIVAAASSPDKELIFYTNDQGVSKPMRALVSEVTKENPKISISFDPTNLGAVSLCEFSHLRGQSYREIMLTFFDKYAACFVVSEVSETSFVVRPNRVSGIMTDQNDNWSCKCG